MISTLARPVPPHAEGSVELLVSHLTEYLVRRGHDVTLFALPDSQTSARLVSPVATSYLDDAEKWDWHLYEAFQVREAFARWQHFDVINCHSYWFGLMHADSVAIPSIHSVHVDPGPDYLFLARNTRNRHLHFCSSYQARGFEDAGGVHVIPHGVDVSSFSAPSHPPDDEPYLAWLGRFHPEKGVLQAIEIARRTGMKLKLAAPDNEYYRQVVQPLVDDTCVQYVGEVGGADKARFLAGGYALLYPVERGEPFGLVLIEAMAAGLPVLALNRGAVPEIIDDGITGFLGDTIDDLTLALARVQSLDRTRIRAAARERFSSELMGSRMEQLMFKVTGA